MRSAVKGINQGWNAIPYCIRSPCESKLHKKMKLIHRDNLKLDKNHIEVSHVIEKYKALS